MPDAAAPKLTSWAMPETGSSPASCGMPLERTPRAKPDEVAFVAGGELSVLLCSHVQPGKQNLQQSMLNRWAKRRNSQRPDSLGIA